MKFVSILTMFLLFNAVLCAEWEVGTRNKLPSKAIRVAHDKDDRYIYIARELINGDMRAGPITKSKDGTIDCHYSYGWKIHDCDTSFDVFAAGGTTWKSSSNGDIPVNAVPLIGRRVNYIGRVSSFSNDTSKIGTIDVKNRGLYYALWNGDSNRFDEKVTGNYQVLCYY